MALTDLVVVSDLHLGRGKNLETGRYYELEAFFYDSDFRGFCEYLCRESAERGAEFKLIFNGDTFDLLRLDRVPLLEDVDEREKAFAPVLTPNRAAAEIARILAGHPIFLEAVAAVLHSGHEVIMTPGNHDIEVQWDPVQEAIRGALADCDVFPDADAAKTGLAKLTFLPWFYHEPGRAWIEHGCQYDPENAFRYPLRRGLVGVPDAVHEAELDNPLGNFFQRYLYNAFGPITFMVPSTRANARYLKWLAINQPQLILRVISSHSRFWWQVLRRVLKYPSRQRTGLAKNHERELKALAEDSGLGDKLIKIDGFKEVHADVFQAIRGFGVQAVKFILATLLVGSLVLGLWFAGNHAINSVALGVLGKALLFLVFGFIFLFAAFGAVLYTMFRSSAAVPRQPLRRAAEEIAGIVDVPIVAFGHSHEEVLWRVTRPSGNASWYFNTGTWIAVFTHDVLLPRERVQFTFLRVRDHDAELMHWSPGRGEPQPVVLIDEEGPFGGSIARPAGDSPS